MKPLQVRMLVMHQLQKRILNLSGLGIKRDKLIQEPQQNLNILDLFILYLQIPIYQNRLLVFQQQMGTMKLLLLLIIMD